MTSLGSSRCQAARVRLLLAPTVQAKTCSFGRSVLRSARNISGRIWSAQPNGGPAPPRYETAFLTFICLVVAQAEHKLGRLAPRISVLVDQPRGNEPFIHELRPDFQIG